MGDPRAPLPGTSGTSITPRPKTVNWIRVLLVLLVIEKVIQHLAVTVALIFDLRGIRATLALDYRFFLVAGAFEALLFAFGGWGVLRKKSWAGWLLLVLALMDIVGEFVAQGTLMITINVSILVAVILVVVSLLYRPTRSRRVNSVTAK
ncbi:MAG TPA: hypothetical protein VGF38_21545 [Ktedonobacterales bacterium]|jgi:hypothetical protein